MRTTKGNERMFDNITDKLRTRRNRRGKLTARTIAHVIWSDIAARTAILCGVALIAALTFGQFASEAGSRVDPADHYPACLSDDGTSPVAGPCLWDARAQGNGQGDSFIAYPDGTLVPVTR